LLFWIYPHVNHSISPPSLPTMSTPSADEATKAVSKSVISYMNDWGMWDEPLAVESSMPPALMATLVTALHAKPMQPLPLFLFTPPLLFSSYLNLSGYETGSAGVTAAWSGLYSLLALRRQQAFRSKFTTRGAVRGFAIGLGAVNCASAAWVYLNGDFKADEEKRLDRNRWGQYD
ncbi:hypothetical protein Golomagni_06644, partial [Golovinomyces magnicellulatus]